MKHSTHSAHIELNFSMAPTTRSIEAFAVEQVGLAPSPFTDCFIHYVYALCHIGALILCCYSMCPGFLQRLQSFRIWITVAKGESILVDGRV